MRTALLVLALVAGFGCSPPSTPAAEASPVDLRYGLPPPCPDKAPIAGVTKIIVVLTLVRNADGIVTKFILGASDQNRTPLYCAYARGTGVPATVGIASPFNKDGLIEVDISGSGTTSPILSIHVTYYDAPPTDFQALF